MSVVESSATNLTTSTTTTVVIYYYSTAAVNTELERVADATVALNDAPFAVAVGQYDTVVIAEAHSKAVVDNTVDTNKCCCVK